MVLRISTGSATRILVVALVVVGKLDVVVVEVVVGNLLWLYSGSRRVYVKGSYGVSRNVFHSLSRNLCFWVFV